MSVITAGEMRVGPLYRYLPFRIERLRQLVIDKRLRFSNPKYFNDPWDCKPHYNSASAFDPVQREMHVQNYLTITRKHGVRASAVPESVMQERAARLSNDPAFLRAKIDEISRAQREQIERRWRVCCLSTHSDNELMWAHYTESHKGLCLEFTAHSDLFCQAAKVSYRRYYPVLELFDKSDGAELIPMTTKSKAWKYEDEYRLISQVRGQALGAESPLITDDHDDCYPLPDGLLKAVIVGCLAEPSTVEAVRSIIREASYPIVLKRAVTPPDRYKLQIVPDSPPQG